MPCVQCLLFPDPRPLVERLGVEFFRRLPEAPGVYLMRDSGGNILYVGKAKNLRKRLCSYRVANPDRMPRRHLRMLRAVHRIDLEECADEDAALSRESQLLREMKPKFNRAGTWPSQKTRFLCCQYNSSHIELSVKETVSEEKLQLGPLGGGAVFVRMALARLLWFASHADRGIGAMPSGWVHGRMDNPARVHRGTFDESAEKILKELFAGEVEAFCDWVRARTTALTHPVEKTVIDTDLEYLDDYFGSLIVDATGKFVFDWPTGQKAE